MEEDNNNKIIAMPLAPVPMYKVCASCHKSLQRQAFPKKGFAKAAPECHDCKRRRTAERCGQAAPAPTLSGRVADSGITRRPNNFGYCNYVDKIFGLDCFPDLISLGAFTSAKDVSESMAALQAAQFHGNHQDSSNVTFLCIGDGTTPRTAVLVAFLRTNWTRIISIDPALHEEWRGENPKGVRGLVGFGGTLEAFVQSLNEETQVMNVNTDHLVLLCVHSHARFVGEATVTKIRERYSAALVGNSLIPTTLVSLPCCAKFRHVKDIGRPADIKYDDDCVFSLCRKVEVWNFHPTNDECSYCTGR